MDCQRSEKERKRSQTHKRLNRTLTTHTHTCYEAATVVTQFFPSACVLSGLKQRYLLLCAHLPHLLQTVQAHHVFWNILIPSFCSISNFVSVRISFRVTHDSRDLVISGVTAVAFHTFHTQFRSFNTAQAAATKTVNTHSLVRSFARPFVRSFVR